MFGRYKHIWYNFDILAIPFRVCIRCWRVQERRFPGIPFLGWKTIKGAFRDEVLRYFWTEYRKALLPQI